MISPTRITEPAKESDISTQINIQYKPLPGSTKSYQSGVLHKDIRVPFRRIDLSPTIGPDNQEIKNPSLFVYDTSGPYTDTKQTIDITQGLNELRRGWILARKDVESL